VQENGRSYLSGHQKWRGFNSHVGFWVTSAQENGRSYLSGHQKRRGFNSHVGFWVSY